MSKRKPVVSKQSDKSAVAVPKKVTDSPENPTEKPESLSLKSVKEIIIPDKAVKLPDSLPPGIVDHGPPPVALKKEPSLFERKVELLKIQFGKSEAMHSEKQINAALSLRIIELLEEIRDGIHSR